MSFVFLFILYQRKSFVNFIKWNSISEKNREKCDVNKMVTKKFLMVLIKLVASSEY